MCHLSLSKRVDKCQWRVDIYIYICILDTLPCEVVPTVVAASVVATPGGDVADASVVV